MRLTGKNDQTLLLIVSCFWCLLFVCKHVLTTHPAMNFKHFYKFRSFPGQCCQCLAIQQPGDLGSSWLPNPKRSKRFRSSSSSLANRRSCVTTASLPGEVEQRDRPPKMVDEVEETVSMIGNHTLNVILTINWLKKLNLLVDHKPVPLVTLKIPVAGICSSSQKRYKRL